MHESPFRFNSEIFGGTPIEVELQTIFFRFFGTPDYSELGIFARVAQSPIGKFPFDELIVTNDHFHPILIMTYRNPEKGMDFEMESAEIRIRYCTPPLLEDDPSGFIREDLMFHCMVEQHGPKMDVVGRLETRFGTMWAFLNETELAFDVIYDQNAEVLRLAQPTSAPHESPIGQLLVALRDTINSHESQPPRGEHAATNP